MVVIDAKNQVLGRLSSRIAKKLLNGEEITVINAEKVVVTGNPKTTIESFMKKRRRGDPHHGPFYPRTSNGILRRSIRGMLPYKKKRGREALKRLKIHIGSLEKIKSGETLIKRKDLSCKYMTLKKISERLGGK